MKFPWFFVVSKIGLLPAVAAAVDGASADDDDDDDNDDNCDSDNEVVFEFAADDVRIHVAGAEI